MFCSECGNKLFDGAKFCPNCGTPVFVPPAEIEPEPEIIKEAAEEVTDVAEGAAEEIQETVEETVAELQDAVGEVAEDAAEEIQDVAEEAAEEIQEAAEEVIEEAQEAAEQAAEEVQEAAEEAVAAVQETVDEAAEEAKPAENDVQAAVKAVGEDMKKAAKAVAGSAAVAARNRGTVETAAMVLAAASLLFLFLSLSKASLGIKIFMIIASGILTFVTAGKRKYPSVLFAVPMCLNALIQCFNTVRLIILSITNRYYHYSPGALDTLYKLVLIAVAVLLIILGVDAVRKRKAMNKAILAGSALLALYHLVRFFINLRGGRAILMLNLGMLLFYAAYVAVCICFEKNGQDAAESDVIGAAYAGRENTRSNYSYAGTRGTPTAEAANSAPLFAAPAGYKAEEDKAPLFSAKTAEVSPAPMFPEEPKTEPAPAEEPVPAEEPAPVQEAADDFVIDPNFIFCVRCGAKLPADSAFCNKCGAPVIK